MMTNSRSKSVFRFRNKRRRLEFVKDAPEEATRNGASCTLQAPNLVIDQPDPYKPVGSTLELIHAVLVSQPPSLQTNITRLSRLILKLQDKINLSITSSGKLTPPVLDPKAREILKDKDDKHIKFVPQSLRATCPVKASNKFKGMDRKCRTCCLKRTATMMTESKKWRQPPEKYKIRSLS